MGLGNWLKKVFGTKGEEPVSEKVNEDYEVVNTLESLHINQTDLELEKIENTAETLLTYFESMIKDLNRLKEIKDESQLAFVFAKIKRITMGGLELNNLIQQLIEYYHVPLLSVLEEIREKKDVEKFVMDLSKKKKNYEKISSLLKSFIVYDDLLNPEKRDVRDIKKEVSKKEFKEKFLKTLADTRESLERYILVGNLKKDIDVNYLKIVLEEVFD